MHAQPILLQDFRVGYSPLVPPVIHLSQLELLPGMVQLLGPNGAGKSTLLKALCGIEPYEGTLSHGNTQLKGVSLRHTFALAEADPVFPWYSLGDDVLTYVAAIRGATEADLRMLTEAMGIGDWLRNPVETYSTGMRKRLALAAALLGPQPWVLLDEPFNGLDADGQERLVQLMESQRKQGRAFVVSLHPDGRTVLPFTQTVRLQPNHTHA